MADAVKRLATYDDVLAVPPELIAEILDGNLVTQPRPSATHTVAASSLGVELGGPFQRGRGGPGDWIILFEPELHLRNDVLVPDLAGWRRERMPDVPQSAAFELAPDWVCGVLSPGTAATDRGVKRRIYAREGVRWLWLVEPGTQTLEVFTLIASAWTLVGTWHADERVRAVPFDAIALELGVLWRA